MTKISINLLPVENLTAQVRERRFSLVRFVSVATLLLMFFLSSTVLTLRILQSQNLDKLTAQASASEEKISQLKDRESAIVLLKNRLDLIDKLTGAPSKSLKVYNLVINKIPSSIPLSSVSTDNSGNLLISATMQNYNLLSSFFSSLSSDEIFDEIQEIKVESLSRGRDGLYRVSLKLIANK